MQMNQRVKHWIMYLLDSRLGIGKPSNTICEVLSKRWVLGNLSDGCGPSGVILFLFCSTFSPMIGPTDSVEIIFRFLLPAIFFPLFENGTSRSSSATEHPYWSGVTISTDWKTKQDFMSEWSKMHDISPLHRASKY